MQRVLALALLAALTVSLPACDADRTAPTGPRESLLAANSQHPMAPGNFWGYDREFTMDFLDEVDGAAGDVFFSERVERRQTALVEIADHTYVSEALVYLGENWTQNFLLRQDRDGLYELEVIDDGSGARVPGPEILAGMLPARVSSGSLQRHLARHGRVVALVTGGGAVARAERFEGEIQRLAYPVYPGQEWVIRDAPLFTSVVEAVEEFAGIRAWRIRVDSELLSPEDRVHMWFSRCGMLGWRFHLEGVATDETGKPVGRVVSDEKLVVTDIDIDRSGCDPRPRW